jgi:serralysin
VSGSTGSYNPLTGIDWTTKLSVDDDGKYSFAVYLYPAGATVTTRLLATDSVPLPTVTAQNWNAYEDAQLETALQSIANVVNVQFTSTTDITRSTLRLIATSFPPDEPDTPESQSLGVFAPPGTGVDSGLGAFNTDASLWSSTAGGPLDVGGAGYITLIHELGHGLGLAHPHDTGGGSTIFPGVTDKFNSTGQFNLNQGIYTMMSYIDGWRTNPQGPPPGSNYGYEFTPMAFDIAVLQQKYGANMSFNTGDDDYVLPGANGQGTGYSCIWDAGGTNTMSYSGSGNAVIDLRPATLQFAVGGGGYLSYVQGIFGGYTIANGVTIRIAVGGSGNDFLQANDAGDLLNANAGNNTIIGGAGNDTITSAIGNDRIMPGLGSNLVFLGQGIDTVTSAGADTVVAGSGVATVGLSGANAALAFGGAGQLAFLNGSGASTVVGGAGATTVFGGTGSVRNWGGSGAGIAIGGTAGGNILVAGSTQAATLAGGGSGDLLVAGNGNNVLSAGAGAETLFGGNGHALIAAGSGSDLVVLGGGTDTVFGGSGQSAIFAGRGSALVVGGAGSLFLQAGTGQSTVFAGSGPEIYGFTAGGNAGGGMTINGFTLGQDRVALQGYGANATTAALGSAAVRNGSTTITLADNTQITFSQVTNVSSSFFV